MGTLQFWLLCNIGLLQILKHQGNSCDQKAVGRAWLGWLPLKADEEEAVAAHDTLASLLAAQVSALLLNRT